MPFFLNLEKSNPSKTSRFPLLPRVGFVFDMCGHKLVFKSAPLLETLAEMKSEGLSFKALVHVSIKLFDEMLVEGSKRFSAVVEYTHAKSSE